VNRTGIIIVFIGALLLAAPHAARANWQVYYTGKAAGMFGSYGRGNFATRSQCEVYRTSRPFFESGNSYCSGFDAPTFQSPKPSPPQSSSSAVQGAQTQKKPLASGQSDAQDRKFTEDKTALIRSIRIPAADAGAQNPVISPSRFVTPGICTQARKDKEKLRNALADLAERSRALDSTMAGTDKRIDIERQEQVHAMADVLLKLLDLGAPAVEKGVPAYLKAYRSVQTAVAGAAWVTAPNRAGFEQSMTESADKFNDLTKEVLLDPNTPENVRAGMESTNRCLSVFIKATAVEMKQHGPDKARDVDALTKDYVKFAADVLAVYYPPALPATVGADIDEALNKRRNAQDMERRLNLLKAAQFNTKEYLESETRNVFAQLGTVERTVEICDSDKDAHTQSVPASSTSPVPPLK
jgi:hypothetical protein